MASPTSASDATTKQYVDDAIANLGDVLTFKGTVDFTTDAAPASPLVGDVYANTGTGTPAASWGLTGDVAPGEMYGRGESQWGLIGSSQVDLTGYATETYVDAGDELALPKLGAVINNTSTSTFEWAKAVELTSQKLLKVAGDGVEVQGGFGDVKLKTVDGEVQLLPATHIRMQPGMGGSVYVNNSKIKELATPTDATDAANKQYVDAIADNLVLKDGDNLTGDLTLGTNKITLDATTGSASFASDVTLNGLTVGLGGGSVEGNTTVGNGALLNNTTGGSNTAVGRVALYRNTGGTSNTALGQSALNKNTTGNNNTAVGRAALTRNTEGTSNTALGQNALYSNNTGTRNTSVGQEAGFYIEGDNNTILGAYKGSEADSTLNDTVIISAGQTERMRIDENGIAKFAKDATINSLTVGLGGGSVASNTAVGANALNKNTTGISNVALGRNALLNNTEGSDNAALGREALLKNTTGNQNTAVGLQALFNNTTGNYNAALGTGALRDNTSGKYNTAIGNRGLYSNTTGKGNIGIGGLNSSGAYAPAFNITTQNNHISMGSTSVTDAHIKVAWTVTSDARDKTSFAPVPYGLDFVKQLQPTAYQFKVDRDTEEPNGGVRYGFKAQDILALEGDNPVIIDNEDPDHLRYRGEALVPVLVNAIQEQQVLIDALTARLDSLEGVS